MNKNIILDTINHYLDKYNENDRLATLIKFIKNTDQDDITDWNNFVGHIVASGFVYSRVDKTFLLLYHKDMKFYVYPGGHIDSSDSSILDASIREVKEETGLDDFTVLSPSTLYTIPIDIDTHNVAYNSRLDLPSHKHFDFRYLFIVDSASSISIDSDEHRDYKWVSEDELSKNPTFAPIIEKMKEIKI